jgi:hypothetical protein
MHGLKVQPVAFKVIQGGFRLKLGISGLKLRNGNSIASEIQPHPRGRMTNTVAFGFKTTAF